jgi:hypothetical protein
MLFFMNSVRGLCLLMVEKILRLGRNYLHVKMYQRWNAQNNQQNHSSARVVVAVKSEKAFVRCLDLLEVLKGRESLGLWLRDPQTGKHLLWLIGLNIADDVSQAVQYLRLITWVDCEFPFNAFLLCNVASELF